MPTDTAPPTRLLKTEFDRLDETRAGALAELQPIDDDLDGLALPWWRNAGAVRGIETDHLTAYDDTYEPLRQ